MRFTKFNDAIFGIFQTLNSLYPNRPTVGNPTEDVVRSGHYNPPTANCKPAVRLAGAASLSEQLPLQRAGHARSVNLLETDHYKGRASAPGNIRCKKSKYQVHISQSKSANVRFSFGWPANCCSIETNRFVTKREIAGMATARLIEIAKSVALVTLPGER